MTTALSDIPKMHLVWHSTCRGVSNEDGNKQRLYYGKIFRVPRDIVDEKERLEIEDREFADLERRFIDNNCTEGGTAAIGEVFERYDIFDPDTDDVIVMYRVSTYDRSCPRTFINAAFVTAPGNNHTDWRILRLVGGRGRQHPAVAPYLRE